MRAGGTAATWLAIASGVLLGAAFLPLPLGWLAWTAFVPLLLALERRVAEGANKRALFGVGYAGGFAFFLIGTHWIALLSDVASTVPWIKYLAWVLAAAYLALYWGGSTLLAGWLSRRSGIAPRWTFAVAFLLFEELRGSGELGFPWFQPGYTQQALPALQLAMLGSVTLVTAWLLVLNALFVGALRAVRRAGSGRTALVPIAAIVWLLLPHALALAPRLEPASPPVVVALVQGDIPGEIKWSGDHQHEILAQFLALSDSAVTRAGVPGPSLVLWPETATGSYLRKSLDQSLAVAEWARRRATPVFTGFADYTFSSAGKPQPWNAAGEWHADGSLSEVYAKRHLVPFGERMPFEWLVPALAKVDFGQAEWMPGTHPVLFASPAGPFSCLICFESIFPNLARGDVRAGARWLVVVTNDEWFGNSAALYQHAAMACFRCVENAVPLARIANTGLTEIIDARGQVVERLPVFRPAVLVRALPPAGRPTLYTRLGDWPGWLACALALWLVVGAPGRRRALTVPRAGI